MKKAKKKEIKPVVELTQIQELQHIEKAGFKMGNVAEKSFDETQNLSALKGSISGYRLCLQAIRDQVRYKVSN